MPSDGTALRRTKVIAGLSVFALSLSCVLVACTWSWAFLDLQQTALLNQQQNNFAISNRYRSANELLNLGRELESVPDSAAAGAQLVREGQEMLRASATHPQQLWQGVPPPRPTRAVLPPRASAAPQLAAGPADALPPAPLESRMQSSSWAAPAAQMDADAPRGWVSPSAWVSPASGPASPADVLPGEYALPSVPTGSGTNFVFAGSNGGGNGWARRPRASALRAAPAPLGARWPLPAARRPFPAARRMWGPPRRVVGTLVEEEEEAQAEAGEEVQAEAQAEAQAEEAQAEEAQAESQSEAPGAESPEAPAAAAAEEEQQQEQEQQQEEAEAFPNEYHQVATGMPGTYDGRWGEQFKRDAGGNEAPLRRVGVNYDDWPIDVYKSTPYFTLDPAATHGRRMAQKIRGPKTATAPYALQAGPNAGGEGYPEGWGKWVAAGPADDHLARAGVAADSWPGGVERAAPWPGLDASDYDADRRIPRAPPATAAAALAEHRARQARMEGAGVRTNRLPWDSEKKERAYNNVDGMMDKVVAANDVPKFRDTGVAPQEQPLHFLLADDANGHPANQADGINRIFGHGDLDITAQDAEDLRNGVEIPAALSPAARNAGPAQLEVEAAAEAAAAPAAPAAPEGAEAEGPAAFEGGEAAEGEAAEGQAAEEGGAAAEAEDPAAFEGGEAAEGGEPAAAADDSGDEAIAYPPA